jgi:hypothetical protein
MVNSVISSFVLKTTKQLCIGDEDVTSFDLVSSDLRDFIDTDFMMEGMLSRPVSRTTIVQNAR